MLELVQEKETLQKFKGSKYDVKGLPLSWGAAQVKEFLATWDVTPLLGKRRGFSKTWVVAAASPPSFWKVQHEFGLAVIAAHQRTEVKQVKQVWVGKKKTDNGTVPKPSQPRKAAGAWSQPAPQTAAAPRSQPRQEVREPLGATGGTGGAHAGLNTQQLMLLITQAVNAAVAPLQAEVAAMKVSLEDGEVSEDEEMSDNDGEEDPEDLQGNNDGKNTEGTGSGTGPTLRIRRPRAAEAEMPPAAAAVRENTRSPRRERVA